MPKTLPEKVLHWLTLFLDLFGITLSGEARKKTEEGISQVAFGVIRISRRLQFPNEMQLNLIKTLETYRGTDGSKTLNALRNTQRLYRETLNGEAVQVKVLQDMIDAHVSGRNYVDGMRGWFDDDLFMIYMASVGAGESGTEIREMSSTIEESRKLRKEFRDEFKMPVLMLAGGIGLLLAVDGFLLPILSEFTESTFESRPILIVNTISQVITVGGPVLVFIAVLAAVIIHITLPIWYGPSRVKIDRYFPFSVYRSFESARFFKLLALLRKSKLNMKETLERFMPYLSPYLHWHAQGIKAGLHAGRSKQDYFARDLLTTYQTIRFRSYVEQSSKSLPDALMHMAETADFDALLSLRESVTFTKRVIVVLGVATLLVASWGLTEAISQFIVFIINQQ